MLVTSRDIAIEVIGVAQLKETNNGGHWGGPARREKKWKAELSYATLSTTIKLDWIEKIKYPIPPPLKEII